jgi:hypothetical protein
MWGRDAHGAYTNSTSEQSVKTTAAFQGLVFPIAAVADVHYLPGSPAVPERTKRPIVSKYV